MTLNEKIDAAMERLLAAIRDGTPIRTALSLTIMDAAKWGADNVTPKPTRADS